MVFDYLANAGTYAALSPSIKKAFDFLKDCYESGVKPGRYVLDGDSLYAAVSEYETAAPESLKWEAHRKYLDIQCVLKGREKLGIAALDSMLDAEEYLEEKDCLFSQTVKDCSYINMEEGNFAILFPQDAHQPRCIADEKSKVLKVVVKVKI